MWKIALTSPSPKLPITGHNLFKVESRFSLTKIPFRNIIKKISWHSQSGIKNLNLKFLIVSLSAGA